MISILETTIWGREYNLPIHYDCYEDEAVTRQQIKAVKAFAKHSEWVDNAKHIAEEFCKKQVEDDNENDKKDNIFSYLKPEYLFVKRDKEQPRVALMCKYRYDLEHGIAIVFTADGTATIGSQDIIL